MGSGFFRRRVYSTLYMIILFILISVPAIAAEINDGIVVTTIERPAAATRNRVENEKASEKLAEVDMGSYFLVENGNESIATQKMQKASKEDALGEEKGKVSSRSEGNNRLPFYYYYNPRLKSGFSLGYYIQNIKLNDYGLTYKESGWRADIDVRFLPFAKSEGVLKGLYAAAGIDLLLPAEFRREYGGSVWTEKNDSGAGGTWLFLSPRLGLGYGRRLGARFAARLGVFLSYGKVRTRSVAGETRKASVFSAGADFAVKYYVKERYAVLAGVSGSVPLSFRLGDSSYKASGAIFSVSVGLDYDY